MNKYVNYDYFLKSLHMLGKLQIWAEHTHTHTKREIQPVNNEKKNCEVFIFCNFTLFLSPCFRLMFRSTVLFFVCIQWNRMMSGSIYCCDFVDVGFVLRSHIVYTVRTLVLLRILRERVFVLCYAFDPDWLKYVLKTVCTRF